MPVQFRDKLKTPRGDDGLLVEPTARHPVRPPDDTEQTDVTIGKLKLVGALKKTGLQVDVTDVLTDGRLEDSMTGAPQFTLDLLDRGFAALQSGMFGQKVDVDLDGVPFRLVEVSVTDVDVLELLFEHKIVNLLRDHTSPLKANRDTTTRAQFVERLLREIASDVAVTFISPEENQVQPIGSAKASKRSLKAKKLAGTGLNVVTQANRQPGFGIHSLDVRNWDGATLHLGPIELSNMAIVLGVCKQLNAPAKAVLAAVEACMVEDACRNSTAALDHGSIGIFQVTPGTAPQVPGGNRLDVAATTRGFLVNGYWTYGSAVHLAQIHPGWSAGQIAQYTQGSGFPARYDAAQAGALAIIRAWAGGTGFSAGAFGSFAAAGSTITQNLPYEFSRGQPGQVEDSWTCMQRLASEVNWRCFVAGRGSVYFVTDDDLIATRSRYLIGPGDEGVGKVTFHAEVGGRTILRKGRRQPKPSDALIDVRIDRWEAPPGTVVSLENYGPADGDWLVADIQRPIFDAGGQITLLAPQKPLSEPAPQTTTKVIPGSASAGSISIPSIPGLSKSSNPIDRVYAAALEISNRHLPYVYGGGHTGSWATAVHASSMDCSSSTSVALYLAGLMNGFSAPIVSGDFGRWGAPGRGTQMTVWWSSGHVYIEFYGRPGKQFNTVPGPGPQMRYTAASMDAGRNAQHWPGT